MNELYLQATKVPVVENLFFSFSLEFQYAVDKLKKQATHARQNEYKKENSSTFV